jgi:hypothetical protein
MLFGTNCAKKKMARTRAVTCQRPVKETQTLLSPSACTGSRLPVLTRTGGKRTLQRPKSFCAPVASDAEYSLPALLNTLVPVLYVLLCCCLPLLCAVVLVLSCICIPMIAPDIPSLPTGWIPTK